MSEIPFSNKDKLACLQRELKMRRQVYVRRVDKGFMSARQADREIALMAAIVEDYEALEKKDRLL